MTTTKPQSPTEPPDQVWLTRKEVSGHQTWIKTSGHDACDIEYARVVRCYFCSCGGACTAEEYIHHFFELGHDRGDPPASTAPVVDAAWKVAVEIANDRLGPRSDAPQFWDKYAAYVKGVVEHHFPASLNVRVSPELNEAKAERLRIVAYLSYDTIYTDDFCVRCKHEPSNCECTLPVYMVGFEPDEKLKALKVALFQESRPASSPVQASVPAEGEVNDDDTPPAHDGFHCEQCESTFFTEPHATEDGYWLCHPCWQGLQSEQTACSCTRAFPCRYRDVRQCAHDTMLGSECPKVCDCECHAPASTVAPERSREIFDAGFSNVASGEQSDIPAKCRLCGHAGMLTKIDVCTHHDLSKWLHFDEGAR